MPIKILCCRTKNEFLYFHCCNIWFLCMTKKSLIRRNKAKIFAAVVEPELLSYSSDVACVTDVVVGKSFALSSK